MVPQIIATSTECKQEIFLEVRTHVHEYIKVYIEDANIVTGSCCSHIPY